MTLRTCMEMLRENQGSIENGMAPKVLLDFGILANASIKLFVRLKKIVLFVTPVCFPS